ncbi:S-adenosyl-L-methionine-dependent methyltransferase [Suillus clintonianus]|uniref:S-adenosyl-L-methionine-dependent methyltransferase n=1 Tax=Suillus clintonianus TaxID=1904413 RepID=UPI001B86D3DD|nr:S-adenosyl-L-methionine-dependent methyltransferase [Suillus clintonianus]KAG2142416.1 S-adenosyl-L-methionine-dependent methyltransferase [Suillus clintonianus]
MLAGTVPTTDEGVVDAVCDAYSSIARDGTHTEYAEAVAKAFGYTVEQLKSIPADSHMGLSCGNPVAVASIKEGETVLDLGSGAGIDVLLAAQKVGPKGQAIGLDMSIDMINLARKNATQQGYRPPQVVFIQTKLTKPLPVATASVDCILSNCVINLLPDTGKAALMKEIYRVLKPGSRLVVDDIIARKPFPDTVRSDLSAYIGCISGALQLEQYRALMKDAGFTDAFFVETGGDLEVYKAAGPTGGDAPTSDPSTKCCVATASPLPQTTIGNLNEWAASYQIYAKKVSSDNEPADKSPPALNRWWDAYPKDSLASDEVASLLRDPERSDYAIIDVRENDRVGGHVLGSVQWRADEFAGSLDKFYDEYGKTEQVIFYCGSSKGRGSRCAAWYQDYLNGKGHTESKACVLEGGYHGWRYPDLVDGASSL